MRITALYGANPAWVMDEGRTDMSEVNWHGKGNGEKKGCSLVGLYFRGNIAVIFW